MDIALFRVTFVEFSSTADYPDSLISFWAGIAEGLISEDRSGDLYSQAVMLLTAHYLVCAKGAQSTTGGGGGSGSLPVASESLGPISVTYATNLAIKQSDGQFNKSWYGQQYLELRSMFGHGGVVVC